MESETAWASMSRERVEDRALKDLPLLYYCADWPAPSIPIYCGRSLWWPTHRPMLWSHNTFDPVIYGDALIPISSTSLFRFFINNLNPFGCTSKNPENLNISISFISVLLHDLCECSMSENPYWNIHWTNRHFQVTQLLGIITGSVDLIYNVLFISLHLFLYYYKHINLFPFSWTGSITEFAKLIGCL